MAPRRAGAPSPGVSLRFTRHLGVFRKIPRHTLHISSLFLRRTRAPGFNFVHVHHGLSAGSRGLTAGDGAAVFQNCPVSCRSVEEKPPSLSAGESASNWATFPVTQLPQNQFFGSLSRNQMISFNKYFTQQIFMYSLAYHKQKAPGCKSDMGIGEATDLSLTCPRLASESRISLLTCFLTSC